MTSHKNDPFEMLDPRFADLTADLAAILEQEARPGESLLAVGGLSLDPQFGIAKPVVILTDHAEPLGKLAWALVHETVSRWGVDALKIDLPLDAGSKAERECIATAVTRTWIVTEGLIQPTVAYVFAVTAAPNGTSFDPRIIVGSFADHQQDIEWHVGDAAHLIIQHALAHGDPNLPDVLGPATGPATRIVAPGSRAAGEVA